MFIYFAQEWPSHRNRNRIARFAFFSQKIPKSYKVSKKY